MGSKNGFWAPKKWRSFSLGKYNFHAKICIFFPKIALKINEGEVGKIFLKILYKTGKRGGVIGCGLKEKGGHWMQDWHEKKKGGYIMT